MKHIKGLDTLRAFAVFFVIIEHWKLQFDKHSVPGILQNIFVPLGQFGVDLFFVLSGYLITSILLDAREKNAEGNRLKVVKNFFIRRVLRIFPIYYLTLLFLYLINYSVLRHYIGYFISYTSNILSYRQNSWNAFSHTWSLAVEEQFYILWPWMIVFLKEKYLKYVFIIAILIGVVSTYIVLNVLHHFYPILVFNCFDSFGIGGLYAYVRLKAQGCEKFEKWIKKILPIALILYFEWKIAPYCGLPYFFIFLSRTANSVISVALIMFVINNRTLWVRKYLLENSFLNFIGKISYGIYLYHFVLNPLYDMFMHKMYIRYPSLPHWLSELYFTNSIKLLLLFIVSALSYQLVEKRILRYKERFA